MKKENLTKKEEITKEISDTNTNKYLGYFLFIDSFNPLSEKIKSMLYLKNIQFYSIEATQKNINAILNGYECKSTDIVNLPVLAILNPDKKVILKTATEIEEFIKDYNNTTNIVFGDTI